MEISVISNLGDFSTNAYILSENGSAVLIDAPCDADYIKERIGDLKLEAIILTHGHVDHISAAEEIRSSFNCDVYISEQDKFMLTDSKASLADYFFEPFKPCNSAKVFKDGDVLEFGTIRIKAILTPGHTPGSACFVVGDNIFSGDTLFKESIGRDFGWKEYSGIIESIAKLYKYEKNFSVYPGHGESTDLYDELMFNPYLGGLRNILK